MYVVEEEKKKKSKPPPSFLSLSLSLACLSFPLQRTWRIHNNCELWGIRNANDKAGVCYYTDWFNNITCFFCYHFWLFWGEGHEHGSRRGLKEGRSDLSPFESQYRDQYVYRLHFGIIVSLFRRLVRLGSHPFASWTWHMYLAGFGGVPSPPLGVQGGWLVALPLVICVPF